MSAPDTKFATAGGRPYEEVRKAWHAAHVKPLWENPLSHKVRDGGPKPHLWKWQVLRPLVDDAIKVTSPAAVERRVLTLVDPGSDSPAAGTVTNLTTALQILLPGESARPHRHTMNAIRFVLEGNGALTVVDGKPCAMHYGDLILTPAWCWHEHVHRGTDPMIWLDALDVPLHLYLGTAKCQPR